RPRRIRVERTRTRAEDRPSDSKRATYASTKCKHSGTLRVGWALHRRTQHPYVHGTVPGRGSRPGFCILIKRESERSHAGGDQANRGESEGTSYSHRYRFKPRRPPTVPLGFAAEASGVGGGFAGCLSSADTALRNESFG